MTMSSTNPNQASQETRELTPFQSFQQAVCKRNDDGKLKAVRSFNEVIDLIARLTNAHPNSEIPAIKLAADLFSQTTYDVKQALAKHLEQQETAQGYRDALESLAPRFDVDFGIARL